MQPGPADQYENPVNYDSQQPQYAAPAQAPAQAIAVQKSGGGGAGKIILIIVVVLLVIILIPIILVVLSGVLYVWSSSLAEEQVGGNGTNNVYNAQDASAATSSDTDDGLMRLDWTHAEDDLNWAFVEIKLSVGDNSYDCGPDAGYDCVITQDGADDMTWETSEIIMLSESGTDICNSSGCHVDIYIMYKGTYVAGDSSLAIS